MSERLPYEQELNEHWDMLPLRDEDSSWEDMKRRLEDEEDDKPIIVWWRRGCALWGILLLALVGLGWWFLQRKPFKTAGEITTAEKQTPPGQLTGDTNNYKLDTLSQGTQDDRYIDTTTTTAIKITGDHTSPRTVSPAPAITNQTKTTDFNKPSRRKGNTERTNRSSVRKDQATPQQPAPERLPTKLPEEAQPPSAMLPALPSDRNGDPSTVAVPLPVKPDSIPPVITTKDSLDKLISKVDSTTGNSGKKKQKEDRPTFFSAGVAIQQQLDNLGGGQQSFSYSSLGRNTSLADYIPSVYARWNKLNRWFFQLEIKYGAPQYTNDLVYRKNTVSGPGGNTVTDSKVSKTYYHQLPLSFNYHVLPGWTIGTGISWNTFSSAVSYKEVRVNNGGPDTLISVERLVVKKDSVFANSYFQALFETQYQWKKFSLGARYSFGLQPYIRFTLPGGTEQQERSRSLVVFLRYQLWKSKMKYHK